MSIKIVAGDAEADDSGEVISSGAARGFLFAAEDEGFKGGAGFDVENADAEGAADFMSRKS